MRLKPQLYKGLALLAASLMLVLIGHEAVHATLSAVNRSSTPCVLCHAGRSAAAAPLQSAQARPHRRCERLRVLPARWRPNFPLPSSLFHRPPPVLL